MTDRRTSSLQFEALQIEGALLLPDVVAKIATEDAGGATAEGYGVLPGLKLRDEIGRYYQVGRALWQRFDLGKEGKNADLAYRQFAKDILSNVLGFRLDQAKSKLAAKGYDLLSAKHGRVPIAIGGLQGLDQAETVAVVGGTPVRRSPTTAVQGELNSSDRALWGIATDGAHVRILRDSASLTRPALIEFDLDRIFRTDLYSDFTLFWLLVHESRFGNEDAPSSDCALESWREAGREQGVAIRGRLRDSVEEALFELGNGVLENSANPVLRNALSSGLLPKEDFFRQLLRLVYRLIFVMTAEDRDILFSPEASDANKSAYSTGYSLGRLREKARLKAAWDRHHDAFQSVKIVFRSLASGQKRLGLPALGGLFDSEQTADLNAATISNKRFLTALFNLAWLREPTGLVRINWRDMATEEFGSVYESLLELAPAMDDRASKFYFVNGVGDTSDSEITKNSGHSRKTTSSYYTKDALVEFLLDSTLDPLIEKTVAENPGNPDALLRLSVIDPACGSGHFILGAARRIAQRLADLRNPGAASIAEYRHALREVVSHCIYGVDQNELAVELCRVALWIEAVEPGMPLSFLDAKIRNGNSLVGISDLSLLSKGIPDEAFSALDGDDKDVCKFYRSLNKAQRDGATKSAQQVQFSFASAPQELTEAVQALDRMPENTVEEVHAKQKALEAIKNHQQWQRLSVACDLFVAAFFAKKDAPAPRTSEQATLPTTDHVWLALRGDAVPEQVLTPALSEAASVKAFHWPLAFPEVFSRGGFDLVLGNPPWDTMSPDLKEFYSPLDPGIRFLSPEDQKARVKELKRLPGVADSWDAYSRLLYASARFMKDSGRFTLFAEGNLGKGDFNVYRMFVEFALKAVRVGGRAAQFVPENLYNGANAFAIRRHLFEKMTLERLICFENTKKVWFDIDSRAKFCMYAAVPGGTTDTFGAAFTINSINKLQDLKGALPFRIPVAMVHEFSPDALAITEMSHQSDVEISRKMYSTLPKFSKYRGADGGRPYLAELHMGNERDRYSETGTVPVIEGRMVEAYDYRAKKYVSGRGRSAVWQTLEFGREDKSILPQWQIEVESVADKIGDRWKRYRIGFCNVGGVTNQRYLMSSFIPAETICGDSVPTIMFDPENTPLMCLWLAVSNSFALDYLARKKGALHLTFTIIDSLPLPIDFDPSSAVQKAIASRALRLGAVGKEMADLWDSGRRLLGLSADEIQAIESADRESLRAEIDVLVARDLFGLTKGEFNYILDPADIVPDASFENFGALKRAEAREFNGVFRTKDLILQTWDALSTPSTGEAARPSAQKRRSAPSPAPVRSLPDGAWARSNQRLDVKTATSQLAAILKALPGPTPLQTVRLVGLCSLHPKYLSSFLASKESKASWARLVGESIDSTGPNVAAFAPRIDANWRGAVTQLIGQGCLVENAKTQTWAPGTNLDDYFTEGWPDGRAQFALESLAKIDVSKIVEKLPTEDRDWLLHRAA